MTTKKKLNERIESLAVRLNCAESKSRELECLLTEAEKLAEHQREIIKSGIVSMSCGGCKHCDENYKPICPQKCQSCRRGAKDRYEEADKPVAEANVISDDFLKSTEATT